MRPLVVTVQTCLPFSLASKYYEKEALLMDPVDGPILASLLGKWSSALSIIWLTVLLLRASLISLKTYLFPGSCSQSLVLGSLAGP